MPTLQHALITREAAHASGKRFYFTGEPCRWGHVALRYTSTSGCTECLGRFRPRLNPTTKDKVPLDVAPLWRSRRLTQEQLAQLVTYLQTCVDTFEAAMLPSVCKTCDGTHYVPDPASAPGAWKLCPDCPPTGDLAR